MKKKQGLKDRIVVAIKYILSSKLIGIVEYCEICGSYKIKVMNQTSHNPKQYKGETKQVYTATYVCENCGSYANVKET